MFSTAVGLLLNALESEIYDSNEEKNMDKHSSKKEESQSNESSELSSQINV